MIEIEPSSVGLSRRAAERYALLTAITEQRAEQRAERLARRLAGRLRASRRRGAFPAAVTPDPAPLR